MGDGCIVLLVFNEEGAVNASSKGSAFTGDVLVFLF